MCTWAEGERCGGGEREVGHINGESDVMNLFPELTTAKDGDRFLAGLTGNIYRGDGDEIKHIQPNNTLDS